MDLQQLLPFLIPLAIVQLALLVASLVHILRHDTYKRGNRLVWVIVSFISFIGPILYFTIGRGDD